MAKFKRKKSGNGLLPTLKNNRNLGGKITPHTPCGLGINRNTDFSERIR